MPVTNDGRGTNVADTKNAEGKITSFCRGWGAPGVLLNVSHALHVGWIRPLCLILEMMITMILNSYDCSVEGVKSYT